MSTVSNLTDTIADCRQAVKTKQVFAIVLILIIAVLLVAVVRYIQCFVVNTDPYPVDTPDAALCIRGADFSILIVIAIVVFCFSLGNFFNSVLSIQLVSTRKIWYIVFGVILAIALAYSIAYYFTRRRTNCRNQYTIKLMYLKIVFLICLLLCLGTFVISLTSTETALQKCQVFGSPAVR